MVTVLGLGFVGLTTALGFAHYGHTVHGIDTDAARLEQINKGEAPFLEPHINEQLEKHLGKQFFAISDIKSAAAESEVFFLCVGTPYGQNGSADLSYVFSAIDSILDSIDDERQRVIVIKSTIPPSTTLERIVPYVNGKKGKVRVSVANNPEFLREGHCWDDFIETDRVVLGCSDEYASMCLTKLYEPFEVPVFVVSPSTAEYIKYLSNTLLATMISYSNEMSEIADAIGGISVAEAFRILHMDKRWNGGDMSSYVYPGCGYGGYCLPKDTSALLAQSEEKGYTPRILKDVIDINNNRPEKLAGKVSERYSKEKVIGVLGLSFKPGSDDVRYSPAAKVIRELNKVGFKSILAFDPVANEVFRKTYTDIDITYKNSLDEIYNESDALVILTAWDDFQNINELGDKEIFDFRYMIANLKERLTIKSQQENEDF